MSVENGMRLEEPLRGVFIVGTGRSGTHFTARALSGFEHIHDPANGKERPRLLSSIARAAIHHKAFPLRARLHYGLARRRLGSRRIYLDQHHPNIFFIREISALFPGVLFLYPRRPMVQIVASMMTHAGVLSWYAYAKSRPLPWPNRFLGVGSLLDVQEQPLHILCAMRVSAHERAFVRAQSLDGVNLRALDYTKIVESPEQAFWGLFQREELDCLGGYTPCEQPRRSSLEKYQTVLSPKQIDDLQRFESERLGSGAGGEGCPKAQ